MSIKDGPVDWPTVSKAEVANNKIAVSTKNALIKAKIDLSQFHANIFLFCKKSQRLETTFTPDAAVFDAAKRRSQIS